MIKQYTSKKSYVLLHLRLSNIKIENILLYFLLGKAEIKKNQVNFAMSLF